MCQLPTRCRERRAQNPEMKTPTWTAQQRRRTTTKKKKTTCPRMTTRTETKTKTKMTKKKKAKKTSNPH
ncbi:hypothetical protein VTN02DRAFT_651 [Thermoascus thermophilus]